MSYVEYNKILTDIIHTLIAFEILDIKDIAEHYRLHKDLFNYWEHIPYGH